MATFRDTSGRAWVVGVTVGAIKRVRAELQVDLYKLADDGFKGLAELLGDPCRLVDVVYVLCKDQADAHKVSDEAFGGALGGDALGALADAFVEALIDFFPDARRREALRKVVAKGKTVEDLATQRMALEVERADPQQIFDRFFPARPSSDGSGSSPGSAGSTRAP